MATTSLGLPLIDSTSMADGPNAINGLANAVNANLLLPVGPATGRVYFARGANVAGGTQVGLAPPTSTWHTQGVYDGACNGPDAITVRQNCVMSLVVNTMGLAGGSDYMRVQVNTPTPVAYQLFQPASQNWGGGWTADITATWALKTGDQIAVCIRPAASANTTSAVHLTFALVGAISP